MSAPSLTRSRSRLAGLYLFVACSCRNQPPAPAPLEPLPLPAPKVEPKPAVVAESSADLIVGSKRGLEAWSRDGKRKKVVSRSPALNPRWLGRDTVLVARPTHADDFAKGGRLERIALTDGERVLAAKLPAFACGAPGASEAERLEPGSLAIQAASDFVVDEGRRFVCIALMDRNINMADLAVAMRIDLQTGQIDRRINLGGDRCPAPPGVVVAQFLPGDGCTPTRTSDSVRPSNSFPFTFTEGALVRDGPPRKVLEIAGYEDALHCSPSGRWCLLAGDREEGDYIYRKLVLLDRSKGQIFPITHGPWPAPLLPRSKRKARIETPIASTVSVVGETDVRWLGPAADELLVIDDLVVRPGVGSFAVKGQIAR
jgi:hypothetical protein